MAILLDKYDLLAVQHYIVISVKNICLVDLRNTMLRYLLNFWIKYYVHVLYAAVLSQKAVSAYFTSKQILPFGFARQYLSAVCRRRTPHAQRKVMELFEFELNDLKFLKYNNLEKNKNN